MPKTNTIPDFGNDIASMATSLRAVKDIVEQLAGLRQDTSFGAPKVFIQPVEPKSSARVLLAPGDLWIDAERNANGITTSAGNLYYWDGWVWQKTAAVPSTDTDTSSDFAPVLHTHTVSQIVDFSEAVDDRVAVLLEGGSGGTSEVPSEWGAITGALADQLDLQAALDGKAATSHTHSDATGSTAGFMSAADKTKLDGVATGANNYSHPNHTGDVTSSGDGATTIANDAVTYAKMQNVSAASLLLGRGAGAGGGDPQEITLGTNLSMSGTTLNATSGGSPGGADTQIQFNDGGVFGGDAALTWDKTTNALGLLGTDTGIVLAGITNEPAAPAAGRLRLYSKLIAGRMAPKVKGPSGLDYPLQTAFWQNAICMWNPTTATAGVWLGTAGSGAGTYSTALPTTTNAYTAMKRARWANVVTTANQILGQRNTEAMFYRGAGTGGGFFFFTRCGMDVWTNGGRFFAGFHTGTGVVTANPSALNNTVGFCVDATDNGAISFLTRSTSATKEPTGFTFANNTGFDLYIFCAPGASEIGWRIVSITAGTEASGTATATLPAATTMLTAGVLASNAALTPVTSIQLGVNRIYVETDF